MNIYSTRSISTRWCGGMYEVYNNLSWGFGFKLFLRIWKLRLMVHSHRYIGKRHIELSLTVERRDNLHGPHGWGQDPSGRRFV